MRLPFIALAGMRVDHPIRIRHNYAPSAHLPPRKPPPARHHPLRPPPRPA